MCKKDVPEPLSPNVVQENKSPLPLILSFLSKVNSTDVEKSLGYYSADSVEWYVEAALNYGDTYPAETYDAFYYDTVATTIPILYGVVSESDVIAAYQALDGQLASIPLLEAALVVAIDVVAIMEGNGLVLKTYRISGTPGAKVLNTTFASNIVYHPYVVAGQPNGCGFPQPNETADRAIRTRIRNHILIAVTPNMYLTNVQIWTVSGWTGGTPDPINFNMPITAFPNPAPGQYGNTNYKIFKSQFIGNTLEPCIGSTDMSYLTQGTYDVMVHIRNTYCPTRQLIQCSITGMRDPFEFPINRFHHCVFTYGNYYTGSNG